MDGLGDDTSCPAPPAPLFVSAALNFGILFAP